MWLLSEDQTPLAITRISCMERKGTFEVVQLPKVGDISLMGQMGWHQFYDKLPICVIVGHLLNSKHLMFLFVSPNNLTFVFLWHPPIWLVVNLRNNINNFATGFGLFMQLTLMTVAKSLIPNSCSCIWKQKE